MPRCKTPRWPLAAPVLVAVAVAGCGAAGDRPRLHSSSEKRLLSLSSEKRLLSLVSRARADASARDGAAVHAVLGEFVAEVGTLKASGQLSSATAARLAHEARVTAAQAAERLHPTVKTTSTPDPAATTTTPASGPAATSPAVPPGKGNGRQSTPASPGAQGTPGAQGGDCPDSALAGQGPGPGHRHGHGHDGRSGCGPSAGGAAGATAAGRTAPPAPGTKAWSYWAGGGDD